MHLFPERFEDIDRAAIHKAIEFIRPLIPATALEKVGPVWAKFESDNPTGSFKVRGGLVYFHWLQSTQPGTSSVIAATRGNHGQSVAFAARSAGFKCRIIVPKGNSVSKNRAMQQLGAELTEHGQDFAEAHEHAQSLARQENTHFVPSFDWKLVLGVSTYGWELFRAPPDWDAVFVPIGLGSGICGTIAARNALGSKAKIIGVVAAEAPAYADSFRERRLIASLSIPSTLADGVACRIPAEESLSVILQYVDDVVTVPECEIRDAIGEIHALTGRRTEGAGAIAYAAWRSRSGCFSNPAVIMSGGNLDETVFSEIISSRSPGYNVASNPTK